MAPGRPTSVSAPDRLELGPVLLLAAAVLLLGALYLLPLGGFAYFGSDTGEYYRLTSDLLATGHLPIGGAYGGWGVGYPDFPGTFVIAGAASATAGVDPLTALEASVPLLAAASVSPLFLLFRRIVPNDPVALLGAGFAGVFMPRAFSLAHPAPLALGDLFVVAALWMFLEGRRDARWYVPLALTAGALLLTHHLSSYFFLVLAFGGLVLLELVRPRAWTARFPLREFVFLGGFALAVLADWFVAAPDFARVVIAPVVPARLSVAAFGAALALGVVAVMLVAAALVRFRRSRPRRGLSVSFPSDRSVLRDAAILGVGTFGGIALLLVQPLPGTSQETSLGTVLFFVPILVAVPLVSGTRRLATVPRLGPLALTALFVVGLSALLGLATGSSVISPVRHAEYLLIPLALLLALALGRWTGRAYDAGGPRAAGAIVAASLVLLAANAALVYPPPSDLGGFQEGVTVRDAVLVEWAAGGLPPGTTVASDHRLSSYLFGADGDRATWGSTYDLFCGTDRSAALGELAGSPAPTVVLPVDAVAVDGVMRTTGVALAPNASAAPMTPAASAWLAELPLVPIYEDQSESVAWVVLPPVGSM